MNRKTPKMLEIEQLYQKDITEVLRELYHQLGTQTAVAKELGIDVSAINRWAWRLGIVFDRQPTVREMTHDTQSLTGDITNV